MAASAKSPIDEYLEAVANPAARRTLTALRNQLRRLLPHATEAISYGMPAYRVESGKVAAGFAFSGKNCGYYPHSGNIVAKLKDLLGDYKTTPGAVSFPPEQPLKSNLVRALVRARLEEIAATTKTPARRKTAEVRTRKPTTRSATRRSRSPE